MFSTVEPQLVTKISKVDTSIREAVRIGLRTSQSTQERFSLLIPPGSALDECIGLLAIVERSVTCPESRLYRQVHPLADK